MPANFPSSPLSPGPRPLRIVLFCRVSCPGEGKQDIRSLDDQTALLKQWIELHISVPIELTIIKGTGSGERLDREETAKLEALVEKGQVDLVLTEDLGRIFRRTRALDFCDLAEDYGCRVVAINDHVDTSIEGWRTSAFFAAMRHEMYNADTSKRIRRTKRTRFLEGGIIQHVLPGFWKPPGAKHDSELQKIPEWEAIYNEWFIRLEQGASYAEIADWLNDQQVPVGPCSRKSRWNSMMVGRISHNPILKGVRVWNARMNKRVNGTGRRKSIKAPPEQRLERVCEHLVFIEPTRFDRVQRQLAERNARYSRAKKGHDCRANVPRKRTIWPGQHLRCGVCGRLAYLTKSKSQRMLICSGSWTYECWNSVTVDAADAAQRLTQGILAHIKLLPDFSETFRAAAQEEIALANEHKTRDHERVGKQLAEIERRIDNVCSAIAEGGQLTALVEKLKSHEAAQQDLQDELKQLEQRLPAELEIPTIEELRERFERAVDLAPIDSPEFGRIMQQLAPQILVLPYRLLDCPKVVWRAVVDLDLSSHAGRLAELPTAADHLRRRIVIDLFDPPQRVAILQRLAELTSPDAPYVKERELAQLFGVTQTAVQHAKKLLKAMRSAGLAEPYIAISEPPANSQKLRRHRHKRFRFNPEPGFPKLNQLEPGEVA